MTVSKTLLRAIISWKASLATNKTKRKFGTALQWRDGDLPCEQVFLLTFDDHGDQSALLVLGKHLFTLLVVLDGRVICRGPHELFVLVRFRLRHSQG